MKKPVITIPPILKPTSGLVAVGTTVYATYKVDGRQKRRRVGSITDKHVLVAAIRDAFYEELLADGATVSTRRPVTEAVRKQRAAANPDKYITYRHPWVVVIAGKVIAECETKREAKKARDRHLGLSC